MKRNIKFRIALTLAGIMTVESALCAFAAEENYGPGYTNVSTETQASSEGSGSSETQAETQAQAETQTEETAAVGPNIDLENIPTDGIAVEDNGEWTDQNVADVVSGSDIRWSTQLLIIDHSPKIQLQVLRCSDIQWTDPAINSDYVNADGTFCSLCIYLDDYVGNIHYRTYSSGYGWTNWAMNGQQTTIQGNYAPIEAIQIRFSGPVRNKYDLYYQAILSDGTTTGWGKNGTTCGTMGTGLTISSFRISFFERTSEDPGLNTSTALKSSHADGIQYIDGQMRYITGTGENYTGWGWDESQRYYFQDSYPVTGWQYIDGYKYYFDSNGKMLDDLEPIIGDAGPYLIRINKEMNCMTIYVQDGANGYIIPLKTFLTSTGDDTPIGTFYTPEKFRWRLMIHGLYTQYATRLGAGLPILMHSIIFTAQSPFSLDADTYNYLGVARSSGCIRLTTQDSKWIYDHCPIGTQVEVYNSSIPGPYERPAIPRLISHLQTWDPTDPTITDDQIIAETARLVARGWG